MVFYPLHFRNIHYFPVSKTISDRTLFSIRYSLNNAPARLNTTFNSKQIYNNYLLIKVLLKKTNNCIELLYMALYIIPAISNGCSFLLPYRCKIHQNAACNVIFLAFFCPVMSVACPFEN